MPTFEVFGRRKWDAPLEHVGNLHAADPQTALLMVRETHFRHEEGVDYAVVRSDHLHHLEDPSLLERRTDISYRLQAGYSGFREKRAAAREAADARGRGHLRERPVPGGRADVKASRKPDDKGASKSSSRTSSGADGKSADTEGAG